MIKFIHTGDIHLGLKFKNVSFQKEKAIERRRELWSTFERIVKHSKESNGDFLLIAGDLFEEKYFTLGEMKRVRDILKSAETVNIIITAGNHDYLSKKSLYNMVEWSPNVTIFQGDGIKNKEFKDLKTTIYGYSWDQVELRENTIFEDFSKVDSSFNNILVIHGDIGAKSSYLPLNLEKLKALNMDYIALGHIHKPELLAHNIAYCGCPEPLHFGETGDRGIIVGQIDKGITKVEFVPFSKRRFIEEEIVLNENMGYLDIINEFNKINKLSKEVDFYRIEMKGYVQKDINLENLINDLEEDFYHIEIINNTVLDYDLEYLEETYRDNIIGHFIKEMKNKDLNNPIIKDALYLGLSALIKGRAE